MDTVTCNFPHSLNVMFLNLICLLCVGPVTVVHLFLLLGSMLSCEHSTADSPILPTEGPGVSPRFFAVLVDVLVHTHEGSLGHKHGCASESLGGLVKTDCRAPSPELLSQ